MGLYNGFLKKVPLRKIFLVMTLIGTALGMTQVLVPTHLFYLRFMIFLLFWGHGGLDLLQSMMVLY